MLMGLFLYLHLLHLPLSVSFQLPQNVRNADLYEKHHKDREETAQEELPSVIDVCMVELV